MIHDLPAEFVIRDILFWYALLLLHDNDGGLLFGNLSFGLGGNGEIVVTRIQKN